MSIDTVPPEIATKIFSEACLDSGSTGRSLSVVSKFIHDTSEPVKLQSIFLHGHDQITAFASLLKRTPPHRRFVRYLFISSRYLGSTPDGPAESNVQFTKLAKGFSEQRWVQDARMANARWSRKLSGTSADDTDNMQMQMARALQSILTDIGERLEVLTVALFQHMISKLDDTHPISLPCLKELTTYDGFPLGGLTIFEPCHQLRRLHISQCYLTDFFGNIGSIAPSLTHLRISDVQRELWFGADLEEALGLREESPRPTSKPSIRRLPSSLQQLLVKPAAPPPPSRCGTHAGDYGSLLTQLYSLNEKEDRFVLLKAHDELAFSRRIDGGEWLDRIAGGDGCWSLDDRIPRTEVVPEEIRLCGL